MARVKQLGLTWTRDWPVVAFILSFAVLMATLMLPQNADTEMWKAIHAVVGTFTGAMFAYWLAGIRENQKRDDESRAAVNYATLVLGRQASDAVQMMRKVLSQKEESEQNARPLWIAMRPILPLPYTPSLVQNVESFHFSLMWRAEPRRCEG